MLTAARPCCGLLQKNKTKNQTCPLWVPTANTLTVRGTPATVAMWQKETQKRSWVSRLKISLLAARGAWSVCPVMDVSSPESPRWRGGGVLYLSTRMFPLLHIHPMLVSQRSAPRLRCMWRGFCRFLSIGLSTHAPPPPFPICRDGYITAWGFLGYGRFSPPSTSSCCSSLPLSLPFICSPRHTFPPRRAYAWSTPLVWNTQIRAGGHNKKGCCFIRCVPEPSLVCWSECAQMLAHQNGPELLPAEIHTSPGHFSWFLKGKGTACVLIHCFHNTNF